MKKLYRKGFTLIELLIVIAILGALAVGLLAALDPFEQLKKGTDTGTRNTVAEYHGAVIRYYAIKNIMPWCADDTCTTYRDTINHPSPSIAELVNTTNEIISTGELKADFIALAGGQAAKIFVNGDNAAASISVCYQPTAKSFINDPNTKYEKTGVEAASPGASGGCKGTGGAANRTNCYYCIK